MANERSSRVWMQILLVLVLVVPLVILLVLPGGGWLTGGLWFWMILLLCIWMIWMMAVPGEIEQAEETGPRMLPEAEQPEVVRELMNVRLATEEAGVRVFRGRLRQPAGTVYGRLKQAFSEETVPLVQQDEQLGTAIVLIPKPVEQATMERPVRPWLHWLLFGLTFLTTTWAGALHQGVNLLQDPERFAVGLPYSIGLLLILWRSRTRALLHRPLARHAGHAAVLHSRALCARHVRGVHSNEVAAGKPPATLPAQRGTWVKVEILLVAVRSAADDFVLPLTQPLQPDADCIACSVERGAAEKTDGSSRCARRTRKGHRFSR